MKSHAFIIAKTAGGVGLVFFALAFTPLWILPMLFSFPLLAGYAGVLVVLFAIGAPCGYYVFTLFFSQKGRRVNNLARLTGFWIGSIGGSALGLNAAEVIDWT